MRTFQRTDVFINETYEYAFSSVPAAKKKSTGGLLLIMTGVAFSATGLTLGAEIGNAMNFSRAVAACLTGNVFLFFVALICGLLGYESGYTSVFFVKKILGDKPAMVYAFLVTGAMLMWVGVNGDLLTRMTVSIFPEWRIPEPVTVLLAVAVCAGVSFSGWKRLEQTARFSVPLIILLTVYNLINLFARKGGADFLFLYQPENQMEFFSAVIMIIGNFFISVVTLPNLCRFAKSRRAVVLCAAVYALVLTVTNLCGIIIAQATDANSLNYGIYLLGMVGNNFLWMVLCTYTTQSVNMYTGSLAFQNLVRGTVMGGNVSHRVAVLFIAGLSGIIGILGSARYLVQFTNWIMLLSAPFVVCALAEIAMRQKRGLPDEKIPLFAWASGAALGGVLWKVYGLESAVLQVPFTAGIYVLLRWYGGKKVDGGM